MQPDNKTELKDNLNKMFAKNKLKVYVFISVVIIIAISITFLNIKHENENKLIAEKFIKAGIYLDSKKKIKSLNLYEEIILSKNKFYSNLALSTIIENNLVSDKNKIINYFDIIEQINLSDEQLDLIIFKKALYLNKKSNIEESKNLLKKLIEKKSKLKPLAEEILAN